MHGSVYGFLEAHASTGDVAGKRVLEVGALDVNGSPRRVLEPLGPAEYVGVDMREGPKVDRVCQASEIVDLYGPESFDVIVSTEMLEHAVDWWGAVSNMKRALRPGGLLLLTTRSPGFPLHDHPGDHWRFTVQDAREIFADMDELVVLEDPAAPGVFVRARKPAAFTELDLTAKNVAEAPRS